MDRWEFRVQICPLLSALESCSSAKHALQIHAQLLLTGLHRLRLPLSKLISFLALSNPSGLCYSHLLFSKLRRPNIFIYNTMIRGYSRSHFPEESISIFKSLLQQGNTKPNNFTFPFLLNACARLPRSELGLQVHCHILRSGFHSDVYIKNSLLDLYSSFKESAHARQLFDEFTDLDLVSFNIMITCYAKCGHLNEALLLFRRLLNSEIKPDRSTFVSLISICLVSGDQRIGRVIHQLILKYHDEGYDDAHLKTAVVDMYARLGMMRMANCVFESMGAEKTSQAWSCMVSGNVRSGELDVARKVFDEMPEKDLISWTAMISGCSQTGRYKEALKLFTEMEKAGFKPDVVTIVAMLPACAKLGALNLGKRLLHIHVAKELLSSNAILGAAIVDMYAKCGCIITALDIFNQVGRKMKTVSLFNSMISGLAQHGLGKRAIAIFREMEMLELTPDEITFVGVLCACSRSSLIKEGRNFFDAMQKKYGIKPQIEHYTCMVVLLGRAGFVEEAYDLVKEMPVKANLVLWSSLLRACKIRKNANVGELVEKQFLEFNGNFGAKNRLLSRLFSKEQKCEDFTEVRKRMDYKPAIWELGWS